MKTMVQREAGKVGKSELQSILQAHAKKQKWWKRERGRWRLVKGVTKRRCRGISFPRMERRKVEVCAPLPYARDSRGSLCGLTWPRWWRWCVSFPETKDTLKELEGREHGKGQLVSKDLTLILHRFLRVAGSGEHLGMKSSEKKSMFAMNSCIIKVKS